MKMTFDLSKVRKCSDENLLKSRRYLIHLLQITDKELAQRKQGKGHAR